MLDRKTAEVIDLAQAQTNEIEELKILSSKLTLKMLQRNETIIATVKSKINNKISRILQQMAIEKLKNDVSPQIDAIIIDLLQGNLDINNANVILEDEVKGRLESKTITRFSLTQEQEKMQVLMQIKRGLKGKAEKCDIVNPKNTIFQLQQLCGGKIEESINIVVEILLDKKDFEGSKYILNEFSTPEKGSSLYIYMQKLNKRIRCLEISDLVIRGINMQGTIEEENAYIDLIEKGLKMGNIKLEEISLGKSKDGLKNISLADIWEENDRKTKNR